MLRRIKSGVRTRRSTSSQNSTEFAKQSALPPKKVVESPIPRVTRKSIRNTHVIDKRSYPISGMYTVLDVSGSGKLREFTIRAPSGDFILKINSDNDKLFEDTFTQLLALSAFSTTIDASIVEDIYHVNLEDIAWLKNFKLILIVPSGSITFFNIFGVWDAYRWEREEDA